MPAVSAASSPLQSHTSSPRLPQPEVQEDPASPAPAPQPPPQQPKQPKAAEPAQLPASERQRRAIERAREFIKYIVAMKKSGTSGRVVRTQAQLAQELGYNPATLSGFMTGTTRKAKPMLLSDLQPMRAGLVDMLKRKGFGSPPPSPKPVQQAGSGSREGASAASSGAEGSGAASRRCRSASGGRPAAAPALPARRPQVQGPPQKAVLSLKMSEIKGKHAGGAVHVMALGEPMTDPRWQITCPGTGGEQQLRLRLGFRARHTATGGSLGGRTFEFWLERLESAELALNGGPLWYAASPQSDHSPSLRARLRCLHTFLAFFGAQDGSRAGSLRLEEPT